MKMNEEIKKQVEALKGTEGMKALTNYMIENGVKDVSWTEKDIVEDSVHELLDKYFKGNIEKKNNSEQSNENEIDLDKVKGLNDKQNRDAENNDDNNKGSDEKPEVESAKVIKAKYKNIDNMVDSMKVKDTVFKGVSRKSDELYALDLTGTQMAQLFLGGTFSYDPSMQRGAKVDKKGQLRAVFTDKHVKEIASSMNTGDFTDYTQIHIALITDDDDLEVQMNFNEETGENDLHVHGIPRLLDGQHRTRACVLLYCQNMVEGMSEDGEEIDLDQFTFSVLVHIVSADRARVIYSNINKQLKLDKSQVRELQSDNYAKVVKTLNENSDYELYRKVASRRPTGDRIVLFSTFTEALENNIKIRNTDERKETIDYINEFFKYVAKKLPDAFSSEGKDRLEFRENNLLNENNFFPTWIKIAFIDKTNYKKNIDIIAKHVKMFNKDYREDPKKEVYFWKELTVVKTKTGKNAKGFAMNNSKTGTENLTKVTLELLAKNTKSKK